jgi:predicted Zn-dependent protease
MKQICTMAVLAFLAVAAGGCGMATSPVSQAASSREMWVSRNGNLVNNGARSERVSAIASALNPSHEMTAVRVNVLNSAQVCAFAWPDGNIYVTRALADLLNDDELEAAIAHEMGHLLNNGKLAGLAALRGTAGEECEAAADAAGCRLLQLRGKQTLAMRTMLQKVKNASATDASCRGALAHRIELLADQNRQ